MGNSPGMKLKLKSRCVRLVRPQMKVGIVLLMLDWERVREVTEFVVHVISDQEQ